MAKEQYQALVWGKLCIDRNSIDGVEQPVAPGSPAYFVAHALEGFGLKALVVSPRGEDYDDTWLGVDVYPPEPRGGQTLTYENNYWEGVRELVAKGVEVAVDVGAEEVPDELVDGVKVLVVAPLDPNLGVEEVEKIIAKAGKRVIRMCLPQGFFRRFGEEGKVYQGEWEEAEAMLRLFDYVVLSEEDGEDIDGLAEEWSQVGGKRNRARVVVTRAEKGCSLYEDGERINVGAYPVEKVVDPVGAGDVFAAAMLYALANDESLGEACDFANAAGALWVTRPAREAKLTRDDVLDFRDNYWE